MQLQIDIQSHSDSAIPYEHVEAAIKFGVDQRDSSDATKYIVAFLRKLFLPREKINEGLLKNYMNPAITKQLSEVFSILEDENRKLTNIQSGCLIFTMFCPTKISRFQIQDENWRIEVQKKITELLRLLGKLCIAKMKNLFHKFVFKL